MVDKGFSERPKRLKCHVMIVTCVLVAILILSASSGALAVRSAERCLSFEPAVQSITGTLVRKTFPGPPNYESIKDGDRPETGWYVKLVNPICVSGRPDDASNSKTATDVKLVQLVLTHGEYKTHARLVGRTVTATGTFFTASTGHHHTPVLLHVMSLELER